MNYFNTNTDIKQMSIEQIKKEIAECDRMTDYIWNEMRFNEEASVSYAFTEWRAYEDRLKRRLFDLEVSHAN